MDTHNTLFSGIIIIILTLSSEEAFLYTCSICVLLHTKEGLSSGEIFEKSSHRPRRRRSSESRQLENASHPCSPAFDSTHTLNTLSRATFRSRSV